MDSVPSLAGSVLVSLLLLLPVDSVPSLAVSVPVSLLLLVVTGPPAGLMGLPVLLQAMRTKSDARVRMIIR